MSQIDIKIMDVVRRMSEFQKIKLLSFIEALIDVSHSSKSPLGLLKFAGSIPKEEVDLMEKAIDEDSNNIDYDEW